MDSGTLQVLRRMVDASERVHALVTAILPSVSSGAAVDSAAVGDVSEALLVLGIKDASDENLLSMAFALKLATFVTLYARMVGREPVDVWRDHTNQFVAATGGF